MRDAVPTPAAFIVEDSRDAREALGALLETEGFAVAGSAGTEADAIAWLHANEGSWDLAVVDLLLSDGSGFSVLRHFTSARSPGKVIVFSGFVSEPVRNRCEALGAAAVVRKPDVSGLQDAVRASRGEGTAR